MSRFEVNAIGEKVLDSKCGLCPYCYDTKFFCLKNSAYGGHLILRHGIYPSNCLIPEGLNYGDYLMRKVGKLGTWIQGYGLECPECHEIIRVGKMGYELAPYFRHWNNNHRKVELRLRN